MDKNSVFWNIIRLDEVGSTNDYARDLAANGAPEGTIVVSKIQKSGKGRRGRLWHSPQGNLYLSMILKFSSEAFVMGQLSFVVSLALTKVLNELTGKSKFLCKWPNDVITSDYCKVSGILIETTGTSLNDFVIIGMGVNNKNHPDDVDGAIKATSLSDCGISIENEKLLELFLEKFLEMFNFWKIEGFSGIRQDWLENAYGLGQDIVIRLPKETLKGKFEDIDQDGAILFINEYGQRQRINSGEVFFNKD
ncbi:MAG: biotin--[acetyl-CoA-carboxylase] ligase [Alphaproteobacteria bacterium]